MGVVYLAEDPFIDRKVAIKTSFEAPPKEPEAFKRFERSFFREARAAGKLSHRNIVSVYDAAIEDEYSYLVMEYVDGPSLSDFCSPDKRLPVPKVVNVIFQCAKAVDYAHRHGVIHRDIKPSNVILTGKGRPKISDFGIAAVGGDLTQTDQAAITASLPYTAPEHFRGADVNAQNDIYSLGAVTYELLTGQKPFTAEADVTLVYKITNEDPPSISELRQDVPDSLCRIVARAMSKDLEHRYTSGLQLAQSLIAAFDHLRNMKDEINQEEKLRVLQRIKFFNNFSASELTEVIRATQWVTHDTATTIINEGDVEDFFFILVAGEALVKKRGQTLAALKPGDCFGEMAYLGRTTRTATVQAASKTILMKISSAAIDQMSIITQLRFYKRFSETLIARLAKTSDTLTKSSF